MASDWSVALNWIFGSGTLGGWCLAYLKWRHVARLKDRKANLDEFQVLVQDLTEHVDRLEERVRELEQQLTQKATELAMLVQANREAMVLVHEAAMREVLLKVEVNNLCVLLQRPPKYDLTISQTGGPVG
jgi:chromosome segregation ATPase